MHRPLLAATLLAMSLLAACRNDGTQSGNDQPTTVTGRPVISPPRRLICRLREATEGDDAKKSPAPVDLVKLDKVTSTTAATISVQSMPSPVSIGSN